MVQQSKVTDATRCSTSMRTKTDGVSSRSSDRHATTAACRAKASQRQRETHIPTPLKAEEANQGLPKIEKELEVIELSDDENNHSDHKSKPQSGSSMLDNKEALVSKHRLMSSETDLDDETLAIQLQLAVAKRLRAEAEMEEAQVRLDMHKRRKLGAGRTC